MDESEDNLWEDEEEEPENLEDKDSEEFEDEEEVQPEEETPVGHGNDQVVSVDSDDDITLASQKDLVESPEKAIEMEASPSHPSPDLNHKIQELQRKLAMAKKEQTAKTLDMNIKSYFFSLAMRFNLERYRFFNWYLGKSFHIQVLFHVLANTQPQGKPKRLCTLLHLHKLACWTRPSSLRTVYLLGPIVWTLFLTLFAQTW